MDFLDVPTQGAGRRAAQRANVGDHAAEVRSFSPLGLTLTRTIRRPVPFAGACATPRAISARDGPSDRTSITQERSCFWRILVMMVFPTSWPGGPAGTGGAVPGVGGSTITGGGSTSTGGGSTGRGVPHPVIDALSIGKPQISWFENQPYRLQPTVAMGSILEMVKLAVAGPPLTGMICIST